MGIQVEVYLKKEKMEPLFEKWHENKRSEHGDDEW
jgi:hypothetical protein